MTATPKRKTPAKGKKAAGPAARPPAPSGKPFMRFYHSESLRQKTLDRLEAIEQSRDATVHRAALADVVVELTNSGMDYYFMRPLKLAKAGFVTEQSASLGLKGVQQVMATVVRQIIGRMETPQLQSVCDSIRQLMR